MAGGPGDFASVGEIKILRKSGGRLIVIKAPLAGVLKGNPTARDLADIPQLESGDSVIVP